MSESKHNNATNQEPTNQGTAQESNANIKGSDDKNVSDTAQTVTTDKTTNNDDATVADEKSEDKNTTEKKTKTDNDDKSSEKETTDNKSNSTTSEDSNKNEESNQNSKPTDEYFGSMADFPFSEDKNNLFYAFDLHRNNVNKHQKYSIDIYLDYQKKFDNEKKKILTEFRKKYEEKKFDIAILDNEPDKVNSVIIEFLDWCGKLPQNGIWFYRAIHWIKNLFGKKTDKKSSEYKEESKKCIKLEKEEDYVNERYAKQQKFYSKRADEGKRNFFKIQKGIFALSVIIPIIALRGLLKITFSCHCVVPCEVLCQDTKLMTLQN